MGKIILLNFFIQYFVFVVAYSLRTDSVRKIRCRLFGNDRVRRFICDRNRNLIYLNNPKVACSSIKTSILGEQDNIHRFANSCTAFTLTPELKEWYSFSFVRNPHERLVSCFEDKCLNDSHFFDDYLFGYLKGIRDFNKFISRVAGIPLPLADPHFSD